MAIEKHPCENGITGECFKAYPQWAKRAFALKLMHTLCPGQITRRLPKGLRPGMIGFPPGWTPGIPLPSYLGPPGMIGLPPGWTAGDPLPEGVTLDPGTVFPPGWTPGDPLPAGVTIIPGAFFPPGWTPGDPFPPYTGPDLTPGITIPSDGAIPPIFLTPFEPGPPHRVSPTAPGVTVIGTFTAQNDGRQGYIGWNWLIARNSSSGNMVWPSENEATEGINAQADGIDRGCYRSFFDFDLSGIPAGATITECKLTLQSYGVLTCDASIQEGTQSNSLGTDDYDAFTGTLFDSLTWIIGTNVFTLNVLGQTYIQSKFGATAKLCMREYVHDYSNVEPGEGLFFQAGLYWSGAAVAANRPKLTVTYET